ncbi:hypothetical protein [Amphritea sp.]|uniref:hypothetical protein n=1 Tax=Amphritea sp. TaxID=1872502 RepID=UPI003D0F18E4
MKKASRFMPKNVCQPTGALGWVVIGVISSFFAWLFWSVPLLLIVLPFIALFFYKEHRKRKRYFKDLLVSREGYSICEFSRHFDCKQVDTWVIRAVYEQLQNYLKSYEIELPVLPNDDVFSDLKIDDEDFEYDILEEIAFRTGRSLDDAEVNPYFGNANIVENLVYFFNKQPVADAI